MRFQVSGHLEYEIQQPSTLILNIHAQRNAGQTILEEQFSVEPYVKIEEFSPDGDENRFVRLETGKKKQLVDFVFSATIECHHELVPAAKHRAHAGRRARSPRDSVSVSRAATASRIG